MASGSRCQKEKENACSPTKPGSITRLEFKYRQLFDSRFAAMHAKQGEFFKRFSVPDRRLALAFGRLEATMTRLAGSVATMNSS